MLCDSLAAKERDNKQEITLPQVKLPRKDDENKLLRQDKVLEGGSDALELRVRADKREKENAELRQQTEQLRGDVERYKEDHELAARTRAICGST